MTVEAARVQAGHDPDRTYRAIYDLLMSTEQGRWFLEEYLRRNRPPPLRRLDPILPPFDIGIDPEPNATPVPPPPTHRAPAADTASQGVSAEDPLAALHALTPAERLALFS